MKTKFVVITSIITNLATILSLVVILTFARPSLAQSAKPGAGAGQEIDGVGSGGTTAEASSVLSPAAASTAYVHVAGSTFVPMYSDVEYSYSSNGCVYFTSGNSLHAIMNLALVLPAGSKITAMRFYIDDTSTTANADLRLRQMDDGNAYYEIAAESSTGSAGLGSVTVDIPDYMVDYLNYSYVVQYYANVIGSSMTFCGVRISYTPPSVFGVALPYVTR